MARGKVGVAVLVLPTVLVAQARQPFSIQGSALYTVEQLGEAGLTGGLGGEIQLRYVPSQLSVGLGYQFSHHASGDKKLDLSGVFLEPRMAIDAGSDVLTPYIAGRIAVLQQTSELVTVPKFSSNGTAFGVGGGVVVNVSRRVNLDAGAAYILQSFGDKSFSTGGRVNFDPFSGYVAKAGLTFGLGRR
jgi:opacity protein-like surface antigen